MNKITPDVIENEDTPFDIILYLMSIEREINELDNNIIVIFKDGDNNKVGKMEYTKYRSKMQGEIRILTSYDFSSIQDELNRYETIKSPIVTIDEYIQTVL